MIAFRNLAHTWVLLPLLLLSHAPALAQQPDPIVITPDGAVRIQGDALVIAPDGTVSIHGNALTVTPDGTVRILTDALVASPAAAPTLGTADRPAVVRAPTVLGTVYTRKASASSTCFHTGAGECVSLAPTPNSFAPKCSVGELTETGDLTPCKWRDEHTLINYTGTCKRYECRVPDLGATAKVGAVSTWLEKQKDGKFKLTNCTAVGAALCSDDHEARCGLGAKREVVKVRFDGSKLHGEYACYQ